MEKTLKFVLKKPKLSLALKIISHLAVLSSIAGYIYLMIAAYLVSPYSAAGVLIFTSIPFILVTLLRKIVNAPRPYELYGFYEFAPKNKKGESFPSRHAFSAFSIGTAALWISLPVGIALLLLALALSLSRVLLGIHFIRDVLTGGVIGIASSVIGNLIFTPFG